MRGLPCLPTAHPEVPSPATSCLPLSPSPLPWAPLSTSCHRTSSPAPPPWPTPGLHVGVYAFSAPTPTILLYRLLAFSQTGRKSPLLSLPAPGAASCLHPLLAGAPLHWPFSTCRFRSSVSMLIFPWVELPQSGAECVSPLSCPAPSPQTPARSLHLNLGS